MRSQFKYLTRWICLSSFWYKWPINLRINLQNGGNSEWTEVTNDVRFSDPSSNTLQTLTMSQRRKRRRGNFAGWLGASIHLHSVGLQWKLISYAHRLIVSNVRSATPGMHERRYIYSLAQLNWYTFYCLFRAIFVKWNLFSHNAGSLNTMNFRQQFQKLDDWLMLCHVRCRTFISSPCSHVSSLSIIQSPVNSSRDPSSNMCKPSCSGSVPGIPRSDLNPRPHKRKAATYHAIQWW